LRLCEKLGLSFAPPDIERASFLWPAPIRNVTWNRRLAIPALPLRERTMPSSVTVIIDAVKQKFHIVEHCSKYWYDPVRHASLRLLAFRGRHRPLWRTINIEQRRPSESCFRSRNTIPFYRYPELPFGLLGSKVKRECVLSRQHSRS